jgi:hypothetical protein
MTGTRSSSSGGLELSRQDEFSSAEIFFQGLAENSVPALERSQLNPQSRGAAQRRHAHDFFYGDINPPKKSTAALPQ